MLTFTGSEEKNSCFKFIGCENNGTQSVRLTTTSLIQNYAIIATI